MLVEWKLENADRENEKKNQVHTRLLLEKLFLREKSIKFSFQAIKLFSIY